MRAGSSRERKKCTRTLSPFNMLCHFEVPQQSDLQDIFAHIRKFSLRESSHLPVVPTFVVMQAVWDIG